MDCQQITLEWAFSMPADSKRRSYQCCWDKKKKKKKKKKEKKRGLYEKYCYAFGHGLSAASGTKQATLQLQQGLTYYVSGISHHTTRKP